MLKKDLRSLIVGSIALLAACKGSEPGDIGPPAEIVVIAGAPQAGRAGATLNTRIQVSVRDENGRGVPDQTVTFQITAGGGFFAPSGTTATATTDASGNATAPDWTLGKSAVTQTMRAQSGNAVKDDINVNVQTAYAVTVRFFGTPMTTGQQTLFTNAAARIAGFITGDIIDADARGGTIDPAQCGVTGQPNLNEIIDDVLIFASIQAIDGPGQVLAQAGPCFVRSTTSGSHTAVGTMQFDSADLNTLAGAGSLQDVITHEMLHVVGIGTLWTDRGLLVGGGTPDPRYTGTQGRQGCVSVGGTIACATSVPVEGGGGEGTADSHWRESTFRSELMTGFLNAGSNPISLLTVRSLVDLGFVVNNDAADNYTIFSNTPFRANLMATSTPAWENVMEPIGVLENRTIRLLRPR